MQLIGLLFTVVVIGVIFAWYTPGVSTKPGTENEAATSTYGEAIDAAKDVVEKANEDRGTHVEVYAGLSFGDKTTTLNLSGNPLTGLPQELGNLQKLEVLDLRNTSYSQQDLDVIVARLPETTTVLVD